jgi:hypothetical protein
MKINSLVQGLGLNAAEEKCISKCINIYSAPFSLKCLLNRIWNAIYSFFGKSDWQQAEKILICKSNLILSKRHEGLNYNPQAFAEFTLRMFVSAQFCGNQHSRFSRVFFAPETDPYISREFVESMNFDNLLDRACFGNGKDFPITLPYLRWKLKSDFHSFISDVDKFEFNIKIIHENLTPDQRDEFNLTIDKDTLEFKALDEELEKLIQNEIPSNSTSLTFLARSEIYEIFDRSAYSFNYYFRSASAQKNKLPLGTSILNISKKMIEIGKKTINYLKWIDNETELVIQEFEQLKKYLESIENMKKNLNAYNQLIAQAFPFK